MEKKIINLSQIPDKFLRVWAPPVRTADWSSEIPKLLGPTVKVTPADQGVMQQLERNIRILKEFVSGEELMACAPKQADIDSWILDVPDEVEASIRSKILAKGMSNEEASELIACIFALYQNEVKPPHFIIDSIPEASGVETRGVSVRSSDIKLYRSDVKTIRGTMIVDPETGRVIKGHIYKDGKGFFIPLDTMKEKYPQMFWDGIPHDIAESLACRIQDAEYLLEDIAALNIPDHYPDIEYDIASYAVYIGNPDYAYGKDMYEYIFPVTINGVKVNPRHYVYHKERRAVIWLGYKILKGVHPEIHLKPNLEEFIHIAGGPTPKSDFTQRLTSLLSDHHISDFGKTGRVYIGGTPLSFCPSDPYPQTFEDDRPETLRANSRVKIIDNGKHKWPAAKTRKGHRK